MAAEVGRLPAVDARRVDADGGDSPVTSQPGGGTRVKARRSPYSCAAHSHCPRAVVPELDIVHRSFSETSTVSETGTVIIELMLWR